MEYLGFAGGVLPFPKVWKETIDSTRVYSSVVGWRQVRSSSEADGSSHRLLEFRREAAVNQRSVEQQRYKR